MKKRFAALALCGLLVLTAGCSAPEKDTVDADPVSTADTVGSYPLVPYTQYASGGVASELEAVILFENSNSTFTRYQVAFISCTCRDAASNYRSVMYVELLNTKDTAGEAAIRSISFGQGDHYTVGMWGDSDPIYGQPEYTAEYMDEHFVQKLVGKTKDQIDAWEGYGSTVEGIDAVSGATVSTSNIVSVLKGLFAYHAEHYYSDK